MRFSNLLDMGKTFVLNDETVINSFGFRLLNSGGEFRRFRENPVMLFNHDPDKLIGKWENFRIEGSKILADAVFDTEDQEAQLYEGKVDRGFLKGCSAGIRIINAELIEMPDLGLVPVVDKWELMEASITPVPSNEGSIRLYDKRGMLMADTEVRLSIDQIISKSDKRMEKIRLTKEAANVLGLAGHELNDGAELSAAIMELAAAKEQAEKELKTFVKARATALVDNAVKEGRLSADKKDSFLKLAETDYEQAEDLLSAMPAKVTLSGRVKELNGTQGEAGRENWDYLKWVKEDPKGLARMKIDDPERFETLRASYSK